MLKFTISLGRKGLSDFGGKARRKETTRKMHTLVGDIIKLGPGEIGWVGIDWIHLAQTRDQWWTVVNIVINLRVP
jgi:hypothetical protein